MLCMLLSAIPVRKSKQDSSVIYWDLEAGDWAIVEDPRSGQNKTVDRTSKKVRLMAHGGAAKAPVTIWGVGSNQLTPQSPGWRRSVGLPGSTQSQSSKNEPLRPYEGKLAMSLLMGARGRSRRFVCRLSCTPLPSILEQRQSAAYSLQHRKKNPKQPGESIHSPVYSVAYWDRCCQALSRQFKGILSDVALHAAKKLQNLLSEGSWGYVWRVDL